MKLLKCQLNFNHQLNTEDQEKPSEAAIGFKYN